MNILNKCKMCGKEFILTVPDEIKEPLNGALRSLAGSIKCNACSNYLWTGHQCQSAILRLANSLLCARAGAQADNGRCQRLTELIGLQVQRLLRCYDAYHHGSLTHVPNIARDMTDQIAERPELASAALDHFRKTWRQLQHEPEPRQMECAATLDQ